MLGREFPYVFECFLCKSEKTFAFRKDGFANLLGQGGK